MQFTSSYSCDRPNLEYCSNASINNAVNERLKDFASGNDTKKESIAKVSLS